MATMTSIVSLAFLVALSLLMKSESFSASNSVKFSKYHGLGNDFILIDNRQQAEPSLTPDESAKLCDRNFGIGGDGVIFALQSDDDTDFKMRIYNSDGSEPEMCGNGIRVLAKFLEDLGEKSSELKIDTLAGLIVPVLNEDGSITVNMGEPILDPATIPTALEANKDGAVVEQAWNIDGKSFEVTAVSMGNPHAIIFVDNFDDWEVNGPLLEADTAAFPARTNVEFVKVEGPNHLVMKVWERGAGPTLACGTGACALTVAAMLAGKIPRTSEQIRVTLPGGDLFIEWRESDNRLYMTGPATFAFEGSARVQ